jgi:MFS family permease
MRFPVKDSLTDAEREHGLSAVFRDGLASQAMATLTGGVFLVAFALELGAPNSVIGLLAAIPPLAQLLQVPSVMLVNRVQNRRLMAVIASVIGRSFWIPIALLPLLVAAGTGQTLLLVLLLVTAGCGAVASCGWNSWMRDLIPQDRLGSFFSRRMAWSVGVGMVLNLLSAFFIDYWQRSFPEQGIYGYSILFLFGTAAGLLGVYFISTIPEPRMQPVTTRFFRLFREPFRNANFRRLLAFLGPWTFAVNMAAPFFTVYMLNQLGLSLSAVIGLTILSQLVNVGFLPLWGTLADRFSNKSVLSVSGPLFILAIAVWPFTTMPDWYFLTVPLLIILHILMGLAMSGVVLATGNIGLKLAPSGEATSYLATNTLVNSLAAGIAPILGGQFADYFAERSLNWTLRWSSPTQEIAIETLSLQQWDFFFAGAFILGLYSLHRLPLIHEEGHVEEREVIEALGLMTRRRMSNFSTIGGLRQLVSFPLGLIPFLDRNQTGKHTQRDAGPDAEEEDARTQT